MRVCVCLLGWICFCLSTSYNLRVCDRCVPHRFYVLTNNFISLRSTRYICSTSTMRSPFAIVLVRFIVLFRILFFIIIIFSVGALSWLVDIVDARPHRWPVFYFIRTQYIFHVFIVTYFYEWNGHNIPKKRWVAGARQQLIVHEKAMNLWMGCNGT